MPNSKGHGVVSIGKIVSGSLMAMLFETSNAWTSSSTVWATVTAALFGRIFVPVGAKSLRMSCELRSLGASHTGYVRFMVGALVSGEVSVFGSAYTWCETGDLDVSSLSGWQEIALQMKTTSATYPANARRLSMVWVF